MGDPKSDPVVLSSAVARPCPFCGSQPSIEPWHGGGPRKRLIGCDNLTCAAMPIVTGSNQARALAKWNWRPKKENSRG